MLDSVSALVGNAGFEASIVHDGYSGCDRRNAGMTRPSTWIGLHGRSAVAPGIVRIASAAAIGANLSFPLIELWRFISGDQVAVLAYAVLATALTIALHLRHVVAGLRNDHFQAAPWTLAALVIVNGAAAIVVGQAWALQFVLLAVSILIVLRGPIAIVLVAAVACAPFLLRLYVPLWHGAGGLEVDLPANDLYLFFTIIWRAVTLYVPVRLVSTIGQLETASRELELRAVLQTRSRIESDLYERLGLVLERIVSEGESAKAAAHRNAMAASVLVRRIVVDSRRALSEARGLVAGYGSTSLRSELDSAIALLEAAGTTVRVIVAPGVSLDIATEQPCSAIRAAVIRALQGESATTCTVHVAVDDANHAHVSISFDGSPVSRAGV